MRCLIFCMLKHSQEHQIIMTFHFQGGQLASEDSGYFVINLDRNSPRVLLNHVPEMFEMHEILDEQCDQQIFCGVPIYYPCSTMLRLKYDT